MATPDTPRRAALATDFDGTMTERDVFEVLVEQLAPPDLPDHWGAYRAGRLTHFEALRRIFASVGAHHEATVRAVVEQAGLQPGLAGLVDRLRAAGWEVVVVSAGCDWYVHHLLDRAGVDVEVHANPGTFVPGHGIVMEPRTGLPFASEAFGIDKPAVLRDVRRRFDPVAFAGDGTTDLGAARLVDASLRFGRGGLAAAAAADGVPLRPFDRWSQVVEEVLSR